MQDTEFSPSERILLGLFGLAAFIIVAGLIFTPETFWDGFIKIYIWDPIVKDAGAGGDAGYSQVNTIVYILTMIAAVIVFQALFRRWQLPVDDRMVWALMSWVILAPVLRVMEDADFFAEGYDVLFISPLILSTSLALANSVAFLTANSMSGETAVAASCHLNIVSWL